MTKRISPEYAPEVRERAVRMVFEHAGDHASRWAAISSTAAKIGCNPETLRIWDENFQVYGVRKVGGSCGGTVSTWRAARWPG